MFNRIVFILTPFAVSADELQIGKIYRLGMTIPNLEAVGESGSSYMVGWQL